MVDVYNVCWNDDVVSARFICNNDYSNIGYIRIDCKNDKVIEPKKMNIYAAQIYRVLMDNYDNNKKINSNFRVRW